MTDTSDYQHLDLLICGGGAAGLFCALETAAHSRTAVVESGPDFGRKLAISGGGRANFSNRQMSPDHYLCFPRADFCAKALAAFSVDDLLARISSWGLPWEERARGRLFLKCPAKNLVRVLTEQAKERGCAFFRNEKILSIRYREGAYSVFTSKRKLLAKTVVLALGSPACPATGANASGWKIAKSLGHTLRAPRAALVPFIFGETSAPDLPDLAGISCPVQLSLSNAKLPVDELLFTHTGLSGPAALQASLYWQAGESLLIDFLPGQNFEELLDRSPKMTPASVLRRLLPDRLALALLPEELAGRKNAELSRKQRKLLGRSVNGRECADLSLAGLDRAEVCAGGVKLDEINAESMESKILPRLYVPGEMLDVTGQLGGYNLHWAFASAFCAARDIAALPDLPQ